MVSIITYNQVTNHDLKNFGLKASSSAKDFLQDGDEEVA